MVKWGKDAKEHTYIVTAGEYSDYHIEAVFNNRDEALKYAAMYNNNPNRYSEAVVEEYNISHINVDTETDAYFYYKAHVDIITDTRVETMVKAKCKDLNGNEIVQYVPIYKNTKKSYNMNFRYIGIRLPKTIKSSHWTDLSLKELNEEKAKKIFQDRFAIQKYMYEMGYITLEEFIGPTTKKGATK